MKEKKEITGNNDQLDKFADMIEEIRSMEGKYILLRLNISDIDTNIAVSACKAIRSCFGELKKILIMPSSLDAIDIDKEDVETIEKLIEKYKIGGVFENEREEEV